MRNGLHRCKLTPEGAGLVATATGEPVLIPLRESRMLSAPRARVLHPPGPGCALTRKHVSSNRGLLLSGSQDPCGGWKAGTRKSPQNVLRGGKSGLSHSSHLIPELALPTDRGKSAPEFPRAPLYWLRHRADTPSRPSPFDSSTVRLVLRRPHRPPQTVSSSPVNGRRFRKPAGAEKGHPPSTCPGHRDPGHWTLAVQHGRSTQPARSEQQGGLGPLGLCSLTRQTPSWKSHAGPEPAAALSCTESPSCPPLSQKQLSPDEGNHSQWNEQLRQRIGGQGWTSRGQCCLPRRQRADPRLR